MVSSLAIDLGVASSKVFGRLDFFKLPLCDYSSGIFENSGPSGVASSGV